MEIRFRPAEWYLETAAVDVSHLIDVPGVYLADINDGQAVYLTLDDLAKAVEFRERLGWDLTDLTTAYILGDCQRDHVPYKGVMYYGVVGKEFVLDLRIFKRERRRKWFLFDTRDDFGSITSEMREAFLNDPDHSDDITP